LTYNREFRAPTGASVYVRTTFLAARITHEAPSVVPQQSYNVNGYATTALDEAHEHAGVSA